MREQTIEWIQREKLIAIVRGVEGDSCVRVAQALYEGGVRLMELPYDQRRPESWERTAQAIADISEEFAGRILIGAGTVLSPELAELSCAHKGRFIVSPDTNAQVIRRTVELGLVSVPGAMTPSEILAAHRAGADFVKLFPASQLGPGYLKAICAPISHVRLMAMGGVTESNAAQFLKAGAVGLGVGGNFANRGWIEAGEYYKLTAAAAAMVAAIQAAQT